MTEKGTLEAPRCTRSVPPRLLGIVSNLAANNPIKLGEQGFPVGDKSDGGIMKPAAAYAFLAQEPKGGAVTKRLHEILLTHDIWLWQRGAIEQHLGIEGKKESAWMDYLDDLAQQGDQAIEDLAGVKDFVAWITAP
jgi:putative ATP-dependent endonuclease of OLD family